MKQHIKKFLQRGLTFSVGGPVILAIVYGILGAAQVIDTLSPAEVCKGVLTVSLMAFIAAGMSVVYEIERLPLFFAALLHGVALYADYILIYLFNGWLKSQIIPVLIFTGIFIAGYCLIWVIVYFSTKNTARSLNRKL